LNSCYSDLVLNSGVFDLLFKYATVKEAFSYSDMSRTTFYQYASMVDIKALLLKQALSKRQCIDVLSVVSSLEKKGYKKEDVLKNIALVDYSNDFEKNLISIISCKSRLQTKINVIISDLCNYSDYGGYLIPYSCKSSEAVDLMFCVSLLSITASSEKALKFIISSEDFCDNFGVVNSRKHLLEVVIKSLRLPLDIGLQSSELLITTNSKYKPLVLELLDRGWGKDVAG